ncbi:MAG TPA: response regulator [Candidatus Methylomirabilis sp.]|nr:response regulator [Candidatus Methylomirabilis sp.]
MMPKILVVDDEVHILKIIDYKLRTAGYTVIAAADGVEGLEKARAEQPDLILLDVMMPRMDGFQALEALKRDPATQGIPVFMLTVKGKEMDRLRGLQMGVAAYITKPFSPNALLARIDETLRPA